MKILFCLNRDIYSNFCINKLLGFLSDHQIYINFSDGVGHEPDHLKSFNSLQNCKWQDELSGGELKNFAEIFKLSNFNEVDIGSVNQQKAYDFVKLENIDLIFSIRFGEIFKSEIINLPRFGILNLHSGELPKYAGIMASFHALNAGEKTLGATLHYIQNAGIDKGDIIDIFYIDVVKGECLFSHLIRLYDNAMNELIVKLNVLFREGGLAAKPQNLSLRKYYNYPSEAEVKSLNDHFPLLDEERFLDFTKRFI